MLGGRAQKLLAVGTATATGVLSPVSANPSATGEGVGGECDINACAKRSKRSRKHRRRRRRSSGGGGDEYADYYNSMLAQASAGFGGVDQQPAWMHDTPFRTAAEASHIAASVKQLFNKSPVGGMSDKDWQGFIDSVYQLSYETTQARMLQSQDPHQAMMQSLMSQWVTSNADHITTRKNGNFSELLMKSMMGPGASTSDPVAMVKTKLLGFTSEDCLKLVNLFDRILKDSKQFDRVSGRRRDELTKTLVAHRQEVTAMIKKMWGCVDAGVRKKLEANMIKFRDAVETFGWNHFDIAAGSIILVADQTTGDDVHVTAYTLARHNNRSFAVGPSMHVLLPKNKVHIDNGILRLDDGDPPIAFTEANFTKIAERLREAKSRDLLMQLVANQGGLDQNALMINLLGSTGSDAQTVINCIKENPKKMLQALTTFDPDIMSGFMEEMMAKYQASMDPSTRMMMSAFGSDMFNQKKSTVAEMITTSDLISLASRASAISDTKVDQMMAGYFSKQKDAFNTVRINISCSSTGAVFAGFLLCPNKADAAAKAAQIANFS